MNTQPEGKKKYDRTGEPVNLAVVQAALVAFKAAVESLDSLEKLMLADKFDKQYVIDGGKMGLDGASNAIKWAGRALVGYRDPRVLKTKVGPKPKTK